MLSVWAATLLGACSRSAADSTPAASGSGLAAAPDPSIAIRALPSVAASARPPVSAANSSAPAPRNRASPYVAVTVRGVGETPHGHVVLLLGPDGRHAVPIFVGETEAFSIQLRLEKKRYPRPLTHDLLESVLCRLGGKVERVRVERIENNAFIATVVVTRNQERFELDARSSDAIALALGSRVPIYMAAELLQSAALDLDRLPAMTAPNNEAVPEAGNEEGIRM
jgi:bifunctional DNase/RNase